MKKAISITMAAVIVLISAAFLAFPASAGEYITTHNLPAEYVELEYIECDGRSGINTEINSTTTTSIECTFQITNPTLAVDDLLGYGGTGSVAGICGAYWGGGTKAGRLQIGYGRSDDLITLGLGQKAFYKKGSTEDTQLPKDTNKHTAIIDAYSGKISYDGSVLATFTAGDIGLTDEKTGIPIAIGAANYKGTKGEFAASTRGAAKIFYVKIMNNNQVEGEFIPAYCVADKKVGMYDLVSKKFFSNVIETVEYTKNEATGEKVEVGRYFVEFNMPADAVLTAPASSETTGSGSGSGSGSQGGSSPATGDNTVYLFAAVAAAAAVLCIAVVSVSRRAFAGKQD